MANGVIYVWASSWTCIIGNVAELDFDGSSAFSISAWVRKSTFNTILGKYNGIAAAGWLFYGSSNLPNMYLTDGTTTLHVQWGGAALVDDTWYHCAVTYDGSKNASGCKIYVDGVENTNTVTDTLTSSLANSHQARIGSADSGLGTDGQFADVRVFTAELSAANITSLYNGEDYTTNLQNHWKFDDPANSLTCSDSAGTSDATLVDASMELRFSRPAALESAGGAAGMKSLSSWRGGF